MARIFKRHARLLAAALLVVSAAGWCVIQYRSAKIGPISPGTAELMADTNLPNLELNDAGIDEIVDYLNRSVQQSSNRPAIRFARWTGAPALGEHRAPSWLSDSPADPPSPQAPADQPKLTIRLTDIPLNEALRYVTGLGNYSAGQCHNTIYLIPDRWDFEPLVERTYTLSLSRGDCNARPSFTSAQNARKFLEGSGIRFPQGSDVQLISGDKLVIRTDQENLDLCDAIFGGPDPSWFERVKGWCEGKWDELRIRLGFP